MYLEFEFDGEFFDYFVDFVDVLHVLKNVILKQKSREELVDIIINNDGAVEEYLSEELKEYYEDDAYSAYEDAKALEEDPMGFYGLSIKDFI